MANRNREILCHAIGELVTSDYILLDLPYYANVGDVMIWQASEEILATLDRKCLYSSSIETYHKPNIPDYVTIVFMGGGNFGDLWVRHHEFRHRVMNDFPHNKIVQLPQSVCFTSDEYLKRDIALFQEHKGEVVICLRDEKSKRIIDDNYASVKTILLPDMALAFDVNGFCDSHSIKISEGSGKLIVERNDSERIEKNVQEVGTNADISDWPSMKSPIAEMYVFWGIRKILKIIGSRADCFTDWCWRHWLKDAMLKSGIRFINKYETIYSTRLHAAVLGTLLGKKVRMIDNSYGKCRGVYELWMKEQQNVEML